MLYNQCDVLLAIPFFDFSTLNSVNSGLNAHRRSIRKGYYLYYPPLGLCYLAASLERKNIKTTIVDLCAANISDEQFVEIIKQTQPIIVGLSVTTPTLPIVFQLIQKLKNIREENHFYIVAGGPHISSDWEILPAMGADFGIIGDGEKTLPELYDFLLTNSDDYSSLQKINGIVYTTKQSTVNNQQSTVFNLPVFTATMRELACTTNHQITKSPNHQITGSSIVQKAGARPAPTISQSLINFDIDSYPFPARDKLCNTSYFNPFVPAKTTTVITARGCPYECSFCCRTASMGIYRTRTLQNVLEELKMLEKENFGFVSFLDETFTYDDLRTIAMMDEMLKNKIALKWSCQTRADLTNEKTLSLMKKAGCINISFGVESGSFNIRTEIEKSIPDDTFREAIALCKKTGITTNVFMLLGSENENLKDIEKTINFAIALQPDYIAYNLCTLFPGTKNFEKLKKQGAILENIWIKYMLGEISLPLCSSKFSREILCKYMKKGYLKFYFRLKYIVHQLRKLRSLKDIKHLVTIARTLTLDYVLS